VERRLEDNPQVAMPALREVVLNITGERLVQLSINVLVK
jgi:hypothetical protein